MKESHGRDLASHPDPESCAGGRQAVGEALTGARYRCRSLRQGGSARGVAAWKVHPRRTRFGARPLSSTASPSTHGSRTHHVVDKAVRIAVTVGIEALSVDYGRTTSTVTT
jgi:hypothetical protein